MQENCEVLERLMLDLGVLSVSIQVELDVMPEEIYTAVIPRRKSSPKISASISGVPRGDDQFGDFLAALYVFVKAQRQEIRDLDKNIRFGLVEDEVADKQILERKKSTVFLVRNFAKILHMNHKANQSLVGKNDCVLDISDDISQLIEEAWQLSEQCEKACELEAASMLSITARVIDTMLGPDKLKIMYAPMMAKGLRNGEVTR